MRLAEWRGGLKYYDPAFFWGEVWRVQGKKIKDGSR
jgi:hypothetical protein